MFNVSTTTCELKCNAINYTTGAGPNHTCVCGCQWDWSSSQIACLINCSKIEYSVGPVAGNTDICSCKAGYVWNVSKCIIDCLKIVGSDQQPSIDGRRCTCSNSTKMFWNSLTLTCNVNCSSIANTRTKISKALWVKLATASSNLNTSGYLASSL